MVRHLISRPGEPGGRELGDSGAGGAVARGGDTGSAAGSEVLCALSTKTFQTKLKGRWESLIIGGVGTSLSALSCE